MRGTNKNVKRHGQSLFHKGLADIGIAGKAAHDQAALPIDINKTATQFG